ncbi:DNA polymerase IV, partial [bacterium]|nr:DNA polymerase IV [bacterium]
MSSWITWRRKSFALYCPAMSNPCVNALSEFSEKSVGTKILAGFNMVPLLLYNPILPSIIAGLGLTLGKLAGTGATNLFFGQFTFLRDSRTRDQWSIIRAMDTVIMCADMDAFFASIEQRDNPKLRGKPVAVVGGGERTVLATCSYEARHYGVKTAMTPNEAKRLCPDIIFVTANHGKYRDACRQMEQICLKFTPDIEVYSIDEVFLDVSRSHHLFEGPISIARTLKDTVKSELGVTCTIGIGPNILIAKLASDLAKPDGLRLIDPSEVPAVLEDLPIKKLWGIGAKTEKKLRMLGISTAG